MAHKRDVVIMRFVKANLFFECQHHSYHFFTDYIFTAKCCEIAEILNSSASLKWLVKILDGFNILHTNEQLRGNKFQPQTMWATNIPNRVSTYVSAKKQDYADVCK